MSTSWYDRPLIAKPSGVLETPLGSLCIEVEGGYEIHCELTDHIIINRLSCRVTVNSRLSFAAEEWIHSVYVERVAHFDKPDYSGRTWKVCGSATDNARTKARAAILPVLNTWLETHFDLIEQGYVVADANLLQRGEYRLKEARKAIAERQAELNSARAGLDRNGRLTSVERDLLNDVWSHHWKF